MKNEILRELNDLLNQSFTPHMPVNKVDFLAGRQDIINKINDAIKTPGLHVILYGLRGTGKTSIAKVIADTISRKLFNPFIVSCNSSDNFSQIWQSVAYQIMIAQKQVGFLQHNVAVVTGRMELDAPIKDPEGVRLFIESIGEPCLIIIDEFDRIKQHGQTQRLLTDTIKLFSDRNSDSKMIIVGVAESINDLFEHHQSIIRCAAQIKVEQMSVPELAEIIQKGYSNSKMTFEKGVDIRIAELSQGYPHYTHLLGLFSGREALSNNRTEVTLSDLDSAIPKAIANATASLLNEYETAVQSTQKNALFKDVLLACALTKKDTLGKFSMTDIKQPLYQITGKNYEPGAYQSHLAKFCDKIRGPVLKKTGTKRNYKWQFINPQLIAYIVLKGIHDKRITLQICQTLEDYNC